MKNYFLATNDVELTSIRFNKQRLKSGELVMKEGLPRLLELYAKYEVKGTFFVTGDIAEAFPEIPRLIVREGHELGSHSFSHEDAKALDRLGLYEQIEELRRSKEVLEDISGEEVISFRAPALRVNEFTPVALQKSGFLIDSSISPQRADMFMSFGALAKIDRLWAARSPGYVVKNDLSRRGDFPIFEIPISAFLLPYIGTSMRIMPSQVKLLRSILAKEAMKTHNPINFLIHPNECMVESDVDTKERRSKNVIQYLLAEKMRGALKVRNLGENAINLYEDHIEYFKQKGFMFSSCRDYFEKWKEGNR